MQGVSTKPMGVAYAIQMKPLIEESVENLYPHDLRQVINEFPDVFESPHGLPPSRLCDHHIPLIDPLKIVSSRSYRHSFRQRMK